MAKEVTHLNEFRHSKQHHIGPDRYLLVLGCDDGSIYEYQKMEDSKIWQLRSRGSKSEPIDKWGTRNSRLPGDVIESMNEHVGKKNWA